MARPFIPPHSRVLDIGCGDGSLFRALDDLASGVGIDTACNDHQDGTFRYVRGAFPSGLDEEGFDVAVGLAVLEHIPERELPDFVTACFLCLRPGGRVVLTVPSAVVDSIAGLAQRLHLAEAPGLDQHHAFDPARTVPLFEAASFGLIKHRRFQFGLNNLFVFAKLGRSDTEG